MSYVKAVIGAVGAALLIGVGTAIVKVLSGAGAGLWPEDKAVVYSAGISEAVNCAAFFVFVLVPLAVILVFAMRRRRRPDAPDRVQ